MIGKEMGVRGGVEKELGLDRGDGNREVSIESALELGKDIKEAGAVVEVPSLDKGNRDTEASMI